MLGKNINRLFLLFFLSLVNYTTVNCQDVEQLIKQAKTYKDRLKHPVKISGAISATGLYNYISGIDRRMNPFSYSFSSNVNIDVLGIVTPLNLNLRNGRTVYNYQRPSFEVPPLLLIGLSPKYKWATVHLGNRSMTFSPYTLSGHSFDGVGVELYPKKFSFSAMYGRLRRAVPEDLLNPQSIEPAFKRMGTGVKVGYKGKSDDISLILFKAWDETNSIPPVLNNVYITPADNFVISVIGKKQLSKVLNISGDFARSALTRDINSQEVEPGKIIGSNFGSLFQPRTTTGYHNAFKTALGFKTKTGDIKLNYEWVDPGYRTLGALFFNNDFQNITLSLNSSLAKKRVMIVANGGLQKNNIRNTESNTLSRFVGSMNTTISPNKRLSINISYSNFQTTNKIRTNTIPFLQLDSLSLAQTNESAGLTATYIDGKEKNSTYMFALSYQKSNAIQNDIVLNDRVNSSYLCNLVHTYLFKESKFTISSSLVFNYNKSNNLIVRSTAPTISLSKPFLKEKLKLTANASYIYLSTSLNLKNTILSSQINAQYSITKKQNLIFNARLLKKIGQEVNLNYPPFFETIVNLGYSYKF